MAVGTDHETRPIACPECGGTRVAADAYSGMQIVASGSHESTELRALVCVACGHTTFYAKEPERMAWREA